jgi:ABC-type transport system involved in multi-copper enzyme maturation permease subunit
MRLVGLPRALPRNLPRWGLPRRAIAPGVVAIVVKELRGRMRARRAFAILTVYLVLLAGFGWMLQQMNQASAVASTCFDDPECLDFGGARGFPGGIAFDGQTIAFTSAAIGRGIFVGMMMLLSLMVAVLAPASTAGAISGERERQTLDLLAVTPISSPAIVLGKLASALAWVFVLIFASIPVTALVFVFGGVAPDDVVKSYLLLLATAVGLGSIGLFFSALVRRTGAATALTFTTMLVLTVGSIFAWQFAQQTASQRPSGVTRPPPQAILYLNPFAGQADIACGTEGGFGTWCGVMTAIADGSTDLLTPLLDGGRYQVLYEDGLGIKARDLLLRVQPAGGPAVNGNAVGPAVDPAPPGDDTGTADVVLETSLASIQDQLWRRSIGAFLALAAILTLVSVQLVSPSRRWRPQLSGVAGRVGGAIRRLAPRRRPDA